MALSGSKLAIIPDEWLRASIVILSGFVLCAVTAAQSLPTTAATPFPQTPFSPGVQIPTSHTQISEIDSSHLEQPDNTRTIDTALYSRSTTAQTGPRRITLEEAKQQAATTSNPMAHLAQLQVEAARQHRLGTQSDYFPKLSSTFTNFHFNKFMGQEITIQRPILGGTTTGGVPLAGKDQTLVAVTAAQPVTPLFKLHEVVNIARADERIAMAKAGMPVETASNVEKAYYGLLVAQRQLAIARHNADHLRNKRLVASNASLPPTMPADDEEAGMASAKELMIADTKVKELTVSLNLLLGYPSETELDLIPPITQMEAISLKEATDKAMAANPEVVEAEQTVVKARAASRLSKLDYVPDFAVLGGYAYNGNMIPLLPRDFSFIGIVGSYNLFDFGKREHTIRERTAQLGMAETALELTKAKVAAGVKNSYFEMEQSRKLSELAHHLSSAILAQRVGYAEDDSELAVSRAKVEVEIFQADLDYRQALAQLRIEMGER
jgi:outer membrane protein TolC